MRTVLLFLKKDLADPMGSAISAALTAAFITLLLMAALSLERTYFLDIPDSVRRVNAEDECAFGTKEVRRYGDNLYCIGEN